MGNYISAKKRGSIIMIDHTASVSLLGVRPIPF